MIDKFIIGMIGAPFGVKGFVKVHSPSGEIGHLLTLESVTVNKDGKERILKIEESSPSNTGGKTPIVLMRFEGIDSPEAAKTLNGSQLLVGRDQAAPLEDGEFYIEDLKGLPVITETDEAIGIITDVIEGGGGDLIEIKLTNGEKKLVPLRKEFFAEISPDKSRVVLQNLWILE
ncbi:MAG: ribosome maturation factor RimM [Treponema sp.]|nr:ribosome maturation factor RimM [Treponema sp.]